MRREMMTGKIPYEGLSATQIIGSVGYDNNHKIETPEKGNPFLMKIMQQCLVRESNLRPDFKTIVDDIQRTKKIGKPSHCKKPHPSLSE